MDRITKGFGLAAALLLPLGGLAASDSAYDIDADASRTIRLSLCGPAVTVMANGDGDTDLDFWLYNAAGRLIHEDIDETDMMITTVRRRDGSCGRYRLVVRNLGDVYNRMDLTLRDRT